MSERPSRRSSGVRVGLTETNRLEAFSDGVFAIVVTLLVLDLRLPPPEEKALWGALQYLLPLFGAWVTSFAFVLVIWVNHHYLFNQLRQTDRGLMWLNGLLLFGISFLPFPTALAGHRSEPRGGRLIRGRWSFEGYCFKTWETHNGIRYPDRY